ncbi:MAG: hypothetical protein ACTSYI_16595 [Promethearchaeota archaeon]
MNNSSISPQTFYEFPWLNGSSQILFEYLGISPEQGDTLSVFQMISVLFHNFPDLSSRILSFFKNAAESNENFPTPTDDIANLAMYPILQIIASLLGNRILGNALANIYAKHCQLELKKKAAKTPRLILKICENLGIKCNFLNKNIIDSINYPFQMDFHSYLAISTKLTGEEWKLVNKIFKNGKIHLIRNNVIMLIREMVRIKTKPDYKAIDKELKEEIEKIPEIHEIIGEIEKLVAANTKRFKSSLFIEGEKIEFELFPPCMKSILYRASQGENLSHNERLAIAFFYLNTNHSVEETVDIFRTIPDFDEGIARYQTEFAAGKGGKGKKYKMYRCAKLKTFRLCRADHPKFGDPLCVKGGKRRDGTYSPITNPIKDYLFWKKVELRYLHRSQIPKAPQTETKNLSQTETKNQSQTETKNQSQSETQNQSPTEDQKESPSEAQKKSGGDK